MEFQIVTDSSSDLLNSSYADPDVGFAVVPLSLRIGEYEYIDDETINPKEMLAELARAKGSVSSACPPPEAWAKVFRKAQNTFAICITSKLSGTYNSALQAKAMVLEESPEKNIHVIDTKAVAGVMTMTTEKLFRLIHQNINFDEIKAEIDKFVSERSLLFSLEDFSMLIKTGRMNKLVGFTATALGIRAVAMADDGAINVIAKTRGEEKTMERLVGLMGSINPGFLAAKAPQVLINHCNNLKMAQQLRNMMMQTYNHISDVRIFDTRGLCSFYAANGGLLVSY